MQLVLDGGILYKYHKNLPWSPPSLHISLWITNTCHQLLIRLIASTLFYSALGNIETHPAASLLKQRIHVQDNGGRAGATDVFLGKSPHLDGRVGGVEFQKTHFPKLMSTSGRGRLCFLCLHVVILGWQTFSPSVNIKHTISPHSASLPCFSHSTRNASDKSPELMAKSWGRSNQSKEYHNSIPMVSQNIHIHTAYIQLCHLGRLH